jgi:hypothetical protein
MQRAAELIESKKTPAPGEAKEEVLTLTFDYATRNQNAAKFRLIAESKLPYLTLTECLFSTQAMEGIMQSVNANPHIKSLHFDDCDFLNYPSMSFLKDLASLVTNHFNDAGRVLGQMLRENRHLERLSISPKPEDDKESPTEMSLDCIKGIAAALKEPHTRLVSLRVLFHKRSLSADPVRTLLEAACRNHSLRVLTISGGRLSVQGSDCLKQLLIANRLRALNLPNTRVAHVSTDGGFDHYDRIFQNVASGIIKASNLKHLNLNRLIVQFFYQRGGKRKRNVLVSGKGPEGIKRYVQMIIDALNNSFVTSALLSNASVDANDVVARIAQQNKPKRAAQEMVTFLMGGRQKQSTTHTLLSSRIFEPKNLQLIMDLLDDSKSNAPLSEVRRSAAAAAADDSNDEAEKLAGESKEAPDEATIRESNRAASFRVFARSVASHSAADGGTSRGIPTHHRSKL